MNAVEIVYSIILAEIVFICGFIALLLINHKSNSGFKVDSFIILGILYTLLLLVHSLNNNYKIKTSILGITLFSILKPIILLLCLIVSLIIIAIVKPTEIYYIPLISMIPTYYILHLTPVQ